MIYRELAAKFRKFRHDLTTHRNLYAESVNSRLPRYPFKNTSRLESQQRELNKQLYVLDPYINRFTKGRLIRHPATDLTWDVYREAVGNNVAPIKGDSLTKAIMEVEGIIAVVEQEPADNEASIIMIGTCFLGSATENSKLSPATLCQPAFETLRSTAEGTDWPHPQFGLESIRLTSCYVNSRPA